MKGKKIVKQKEKVALAKRILEAEQKLEKATDPKEIKMLQNKIIELTEKVDNMEDLFEIDEIIQELLDK